jgi:hypothetical protein
MPTCVLTRLPSGHFLARCVDGLIGCLEKEGTRNYRLSVLLLQYLLCLRVPALLHKRGQWFNRLCVDLEHLQLSSRSLEVAKYAVSDVWVPVI